MTRRLADGLAGGAASEADEEAFEVIRPPESQARPLLAHIPHASTLIPPDVRAAIVLDDHALRREVLRLTDWHTEDLFGWLARHGATRFVNRLSRLVIDPERFTDPEREPMEAVGQGVVYTRAIDGRVLRRPDVFTRERLIERYHRPYHAALDRVVGDLLGSFGGCTLLDCHSFPSVPLPSELDRSSARPDICIGRDPIHTPDELAANLARAFRSEGLSVAFDQPYAGSIVPSACQGDRRLRSVMIEVRRDLYMDESSGIRLPSFDEVSATIERAVVGSGALA